MSAWFTTNPGHSRTGAILAATIDNSTRRKRSRGICLAIARATAAATLSTLASPGAHATAWDFAPSATLSETYSDNLKLATEGRERSDTITEFAPGFALTGSSRRFNFRMHYTMQNLAYARSTSKVTTNHLLNADTKAELLRDLFFLDGMASVTQQNISPFGPQASTNYNLSNNRTEVRTYRVSPYLMRRFGGTATAELRYSRDSSSTSAVGLRSTKSDRFLLNLNSGQAFSTLGWGMQFDKREMNYTKARPVDMQSATASLRYLVSPRLRLTANGGYEENGYVALGQKPEGYFWSTGFAWNPSERTSLAASAGHRFYGKTYALSSSLRSRYAVWSIGYNEDLTTTQGQFTVPVTIDTSAFLNQLWQASIPDPDARQQAVDAFMRDTGLPSALAESVNTFTNRVFLQKSLQASIAVNGTRNTVVLSLFNTMREAQTGSQADSELLGTNSLASDDKLRQTGANLSWNCRVSPRANANISVGYTHVNSVSTGRNDINKTMRIALAEKFRPKLKGTIEVRRLQQDSDQGTDVLENAVAAILTMDF